METKGWAFNPVGDIRPWGRFAETSVNELGNSISTTVGLPHASLGEKMCQSLAMFISNASSNVAPGLRGRSGDRVRTRTTCWVAVTRTPPVAVPEAATEDAADQSPTAFANAPVKGKQTRKPRWSQR